MERTQAPMPSVASLQRRVMAAMDKQAQITDIQNKLRAETDKLLREILQILLDCGKTVAERQEKNLDGVLEHLSKISEELE